MKVKLTISPAAPICWAVIAAIEPNVWLCCVAAALAVHEAAHLCAVYALGGGIRSVRITPAGLEITRDRRLTSYAGDAAVCIAGPAASIAAGAAFLPLGGIWRFFAASSLALGVLNLLPSSGLDGGRALFALLCTRTSPERAKNIVRPVSVAVSVLTWAASVWLILFTAGNFSLFLLSAVLFCSDVFSQAPDTSP